MVADGLQCLYIAAFPMLQTLQTTFCFEIREIRRINFHLMSNEFRGFCIWWIFCTSATSAKSAGSAEFTWPAELEQLDIETNLSDARITQNLPQQRIKYSHLT